MCCLLVSNPNPGTDGILPRVIAHKNGKPVMQLAEALKRANRVPDMVKNKDAQQRIK